MTARPRRWPRPCRTIPGGSRGRTACFSWQREPVALECASVGHARTKINYVYLSLINRKCMETAYLNAFLVVVDTGSLAEAARRLNVTPAAIAQQIHVLERELGTALLGRAG